MKVLVRLPNWLGDTVMAVPALRSLRSGLAPGDRIAAAGPWVSLLAAERLADEWVAYPRAWNARLRAAEAAARLRPDVALVLPNSLESALAAWYSGARRRIGYDTAGRGPLLTDRLPLPAPRRHQVDEYLALLDPLGIAAVTREPALAPPADPALETARLLDECAPAGAPRVGIHLGAAFGASKIWPAERVAGLCRLLRARGLVPVLLGAPADAALERAVRQQLSDGEPPSLVGRDRPDLLPGLLARLDAFVGGDTGTAHLAAALGTPVVALFGPTDPELSAPRGPATVITKRVPCAPCFYARCPIDHVCMRAIEADEVAAAVRARLDRRRA